MTGARPVELKGDTRRQAVPSIQGTVYQAWCSIDAWLRLSDPEQVIYLEGAEDFDVVGSPQGEIAVQVKRNEGSISLGNAKAHEALENFWTLTVREPNRRVSMHYLTTSPSAMERDAAFGGLQGLDAWRAARTNAALAKDVASYLAVKLSPTGALRQFLLSATTDEVQEKLIRRFDWFTNQPDIDVVQQSVLDRISSLLVARGRPASLASRVRVFLESRFWTVIVREQSERRCLTQGDLLRQFEDATTAYLPLPLEQLPELLVGGNPGLGLLRLLVQKAPPVPAPLIPRAELEDQIAAVVDARRAVLLTGTVYKGKTTLAQQVAMSRCPEAWWVNLTERRPDQVDNLLLALASEIEQGKCPGLVVIEDLDISPVAHRAYGSSLSLVIHRALVSGHGVILTAQGTSDGAGQWTSTGQLVVIDVPELHLEEIERLCIKEGCPRDDAKATSFMVYTLTRGHPKLVQVRLLELSNQSWPAPAMSDFTAPSAATQSARQLARQLLSQSVPPRVAEFLYSASASTVLLHRSVALTLAEQLGIENSGMFWMHWSESGLNASRGSGIERRRFCKALSPKSGAMLACSKRTCNCTTRFFQSRHSAHPKQPHFSSMHFLDAHGLW